MLGLGWPQVPQLFQKHSWNFAMTLSPSVHKAASHLELLQCLIDDWVKEFKSRSTSRVSLSDVQTVPYNTVRGICFTIFDIFIPCLPFFQNLISLCCFNFVILVRF